MSDYTKERLKVESDKRESIHANHESSRPLSDDYEYLGLAGEWMLGELCGLMPNLTLMPNGDGGVDQMIPLFFSFDVKVARKPFNLIHEQGQPFADIFILGRYIEDEKRGEPIGWEWGSVLKRAPVKDFGYGVINHYIPAGKLKSMELLKQRMVAMKKAY